MNNPSIQTKQKLFKVLIGESSITDFEQWLYDNKNNLEAELNPNFYLDLISLSFNQKDSFLKLKDKIFQYIDINEYNIWRTKRLLKDIIDNKIEIVTATRKLRDLYFDMNEEFIPTTLGIYYESELDDVPVPSEYKLWDSNGLKEKLKKVDFYREDFITDVKEFLATLTKSILTLATIIFIFLFSACSSQKKSKTPLQTPKSAYELADAFLNRLRDEKADTILFYKRTCINCCDFFNVFWSLNGQRHLTKFYFDFDDMQTHSKTMHMASDKVFEILNKNFFELKNTLIKDNTHKNKDRTSTPSMVDHYCYAAISIYTQQDSIITDRIKDHDFDQYTDLGLYPENKEKRLINDNYVENNNSKWNLLLITIENKIAIMPGTIKRELETLRITKTSN